eukprot:COSAG06_NODE_268_length_18811_cov_4.369549_3_plen_167_part_00
MTDPQRVLLFGFSQGATVTWTCLLGAWPTTTAAAANGHGGGFLKGGAAISGRLMPNLLRPGDPMHERLLPPVGARQWSVPRAVHVFASHGTQDTITPVAIGRENARLFPEYLARDGGGGGAGVEEEWEGVEEGGGALEWHEYSGDDHELGAQCMADVTDFLKRHAE